MESHMLETGQMVTWLDAQNADRGPNYAADPTGNRTGEAPSEALQKVLIKTAEDALQALDATLVRAKVPTTVEHLQQKLDTMRGAVTMAYPMGLPVRVHRALTTHSVARPQSGTACGVPCLRAV